MIGKLLRYTAGIFFLSSSQILLAQDNLYLHGSLIAEPCIVAPEDKDISVNFKTIVNKHLYSNTRTIGENFKLHLMNCDLTIGKSVTVTITGAESLQLPGMLALNGGIAIGIESGSGTFIPINKPGQPKSLVDDEENIISFYAFVQGEPDALINRTISEGPFSTTATLNLNYE